MDIGQNNFVGAHSLLSSLITYNIDQFFVSPGSRSTPLVLALTQFKDIGINIVLDERSASFGALGFTKTSPNTPALICTSGTAVANYLPAVIEASQSRTPFVIVTADRPNELVGTGAPQTIVQNGIFSEYVCDCIDFEPAPLTDFDIFRLISGGIREMFETGLPLHINVQFRKPLQPKKLPTVTTPSHRESMRVDKRNERLVVDLPKAQHPLIIAGEIHPDKAKWIDTKPLDGIPSLVEPFSNLPKLWSNWERALISQMNSGQAPDVIIRFGRTPVNQFLYRYLEQHKSVPTIHLSFDGFFDNPVSGNVVEKILVDDSFSIKTNKVRPTEKWSDSWKIQAASNMESTQSFTDGQVHQVISMYSKDKNCFYSNSFPVRDAQTFGYPKKTSIYVNRGASGIDGILSTIAGITLGNRKNTMGVVGDLAFQHDTNGLAFHHELSSLNLAATIVVINNGGGGIFSMLPIQNYPEVFESFFFTPQKVSIASLCAAHGVPHISCKSKDEFEENLQTSHESGFRVIECFTDHEVSMASRKVRWNQR